MRVKIVAANCTLGKAGTVVTVDPDRVNVAALIKAGTVEAAPPAKKSSKKKTAPAEGNDD